MAETPKKPIHRCLPCEGLTGPLEPVEIQKRLKDIPGWSVAPDGVLEREWTLKNFRRAVAFVNAIAEAAERENHHPDLTLHSYRKLKVRLSTHAVKGLSLNDFLLADTINAIAEEFST